MRLNKIPTLQPVIVDCVVPTSKNDMTAKRLEEIGFVFGERAVILQYGPFGKNPMLVQIGYTRFALRQDEAARVKILSQEFNQTNHQATNNEQERHIKNHSHKNYKIILQRLLLQSNAALHLTRFKQLFNITVSWK